ncbi:MAG: OsmC family protein [Motiliproteus sp.]
MTGLRRAFVQKDAEHGKFKFRANNHWINGTRNRSAIQGFFAGGKEDHSRKQALVVDTDQPHFLGGDNTAPNPVEHLLHSLDSCLTTTLVYHASVQGVHLEEVETSSEGDLDAQGFFGISDTVAKGYQGIRVNMRVKSDARSDELIKLAMHSPVFEMLSNAVPVEFSLTTS